MKPTFLTIALMMGASMGQAQINVNIDAQQRGPEISPTHYGIFYEDINHAADGGIYAELIRNRSFEDGPRYGAPADMQGCPRMQRHHRSSPPPSFNRLRK